MGGEERGLKENPLQTRDEFPGPVDWLKGPVGAPD